MGIDDKDVDDASGQYAEKPDPGKDLGSRGPAAGLLGLLFT